jgi:predicted P-loop ATPase
MLSPSEAAVKAAIANVWPYGATRESFNGQDYCHSGVFHPSHVRKIANLTRVTSVFCDIDFVDLLKVVYPGAEVEDLKAKLYEVLCSDDDPCHADLMGCAAEALVEAIRESNLPIPSLVLCSGWGLHVHWALQRDTGEKLAKAVVAKDASVKQIHKIIDERISARFPRLLRARLDKSGEWSPEVGEIFLDEAALSAWGAEGVVDKQARDLGTRLVRYPGTVNTKQPEAIEVHALYASETILPNWSMLSHAARPAALPAEGKLSGKERIQAKRSADNAFLRQVEEAARKVSTPIPFHLTFVKAGSFEGMSLRAIGDEQLPTVEGEEPDPSVKVNIVSPWRPGAPGGSEGSAFLAREEDGRLSVYCNITEKRYIDSVDPTVDPGGGPEKTESRSPWGNEVGGARLLSDTSKVVEGRATPYLTTTNILLILTNDAHYDTLVYDTFSGGFRMVYPDPDTGEVFSRPISESALITDVVVHAWNYYSKFYLEGSQAQNVCKRALKMFAQLRTDEETGRKYRQDWLKEYVLSHKEKWDGVPRLDEWLVHTTGCEDTTLNRIYGRKWMLQLAATGLGLGSAQAILLLRGKQGGGKSSFGQILRWGKRRLLLNAEEKAQPSAYTDKLSDPTGSSRDMVSSLRTAWLVEDAEALVLGHKHTGAVKALLTSDTIKARAMYEMEDVEVHLRCCLYASGNEDVELSDTTGSRRVFAVDVADRMNLDYLREHRDALFGEAVTYLLSDEAQSDIVQGRTPWVIQADEKMEVDGEQVGVLAAQSEANEQYTETNLWKSAADAVFRSNAGGRENGFTLTEFLLAADDSLSTSRIGRSIQIRAGKALRVAGFRKQSVRGSSADVWVAPEPHPQWVGVKQHSTGLSVLGIYDLRRRAAAATLKVVK